VDADAEAGAAEEEDPHLYQMDPASGIQYWAVGTNCCGARSEFSCGAVFKGGAKAGLVVRSEKPTDVVYRRMPDNPTLKYYKKAAEVATYVYPVTTNLDAALFVEWVEDLEGGHQAKEMAGYKVIAMSSLGFFLFSIPMLLLFHYSSPVKDNRKRPTQFATVYRATV